MDQLSGHQEVEIPMPINSAYVGGVLHGHGHAHHHGHDMTHHHDAPPPSSSMPHQIIIPQQSSQNGISANNMEEDEEEGELGQGYNGNLTGDRKKKGVVRVRYRECLKNHAATMGGNARDGCGEFMASGEEGSIEALTCSACNCHRNFHRKEFEGEQHLIIPSSANSPFYPPTPHSAAALLGTSRGRKVILGSANVIPFSARSVPPINMAYLPPSDQDHHHDHHGNGGGVMIMRQPLNHLDHHQHHQHQMVNKKRFRTKFSQEQKEKMLEFAERIGWKFQKQEEGVVQQFCQEIGVKRRVLKVWMHNNKHTLATKTNNNNNNFSNNINSSSSI